MADAVARTERHRLKLSLPLLTVCWVCATARHEGVTHTAGNHHDLAI